MQEGAFRTRGPVVPRRTLASSGRRVTFGSPYASVTVEIKETVILAKTLVITFLNAGYPTNDGRRIDGRGRLTIRRLGAISSATVQTEAGQIRLRLSCPKSPLL